MSTGRPHRFLLATDLDGTLVGDAAALARLNHDLAQVRDRVALVYVTGRMLASTLALIASEGLLVPDAIVAGVGTAIHLAPSWPPEADWERHLSNGWSASAVDAAAAELPALELQPADARGPFKRSFWLAPGQAVATMGALAEGLHERRVLARLIYSSDRDLDVIPSRGGKGPATLYLSGRLGVAAEHIVACGDSGNDLDLVTVGGLSVIVANARPELLRQAPAHAYLAAAPCAGGVHEALRHYGIV